VVLVVSITIFAGCQLRRPTVTPMHVLNDHSGCGTRASTLVVMLPGVYSKPDEFVDEGFVAALRRHSLLADVVMADAHLGYFTDGTVLERLRQDIVMPARQAGYRRIWLVGISLGGFASLSYAARHGEDIDGVLAIAPYPGTRGLQREIVEAGGPRAWSQTAGATGDELERVVWRWLADGSGGRRPPLFLGLGGNDRFADGVRLMASTLPPSHLATVPGGHDWGPWLAIWEGWLERGLLADTCVASLSGR